MQAVSNMLQGNPFATPSGQLIERATEGAQPSEDWGLLMAICDTINDSEDGPRDALRAIRRRLAMAAGRSNSSIQYSLSVLETCVKNCGHRFHLVVTRRDFLEELLRLIGPKNEPPQQVQDRVLGLLQSWSDAFRGRAELREVERMVDELRAKGVEFPMTDLDAMAPIYTPARSVPAVAAAPAGLEADSGPVSPSRVGPVPPSKSLDQPHHQLRRAPAPAPGAGSSAAAGPAQTPSPEQLAKLRSELDVVQGNVRVFNEMLNELTPDTVQPEDLSLLHELNRTTRQMQLRIVDLIDQVANDEVVGELLRINDDLNNAILRYDRFERYRVACSASKQPQPQPQPLQAPPPFNPMFDRPDSLPQQSQQPPPPPLIDLSTPEDGTAPSLSQQLAGIRVSSAATPAAPAPAATPVGAALEQSDEFDMFASSRQAFDRNRAGAGAPGAAGPAYAAAAERQLPGGLQNGLAQRATAVAASSDAATGGSAAAVSSAEFNMFLQQQQPAQPGGGVGATAGDRSRTLKHRDDQPEDTLFAL